MAGRDPGPTPELDCHGTSARAVGLGGLSNSDDQVTGAGKGMTRGHAV